MLAPSAIVLPLLNHLLSGEEWARLRLQPFRGQTALIEGGPIRLAMTVDDSGLFRTATREEAAAVTISFGPEAPVKLLTEPAGLFASARLSGAANFAETLAFVFRNLRWDYEGDLAGVIGDIPARRLARLLVDGINWHRSSVQRLGENFAEYVTEESLLLATARDLLRFAEEVDRLRDDLARLEKRVARL